MLYKETYHIKFINISNWSRLPLTLIRSFELSIVGSFEETTKVSPIDHFPFHGVGLCLISNDSKAHNAY